MAELLKLKRAIELTWMQLITEKPVRTDLHLRMKKLAGTSYVNMFGGYKEFMQSLATVGKGAEEYNHWLSTQMLVMSYLENDAQLLNEMYKMYTDTLLGTAGGEVADVLVKYKTEKPDRSFLIALAFRIYLDTLYLTEESPPSSRPEVPNEPRS